MPIARPLSQVRLTFNDFLINPAPITPLILVATLAVLHVILIEFSIDHALSGDLRVPPLRAGSRRLHQGPARIGRTTRFQPWDDASGTQPDCRCRRTISWGLRRLSRFAARRRYSASAMSFCWQPGVFGSSGRRCT